jgi:hypothetical protein
MLMMSTLTRAQKDYASEQVFKHDGKELII